MTLQGDFTPEWNSRSGAKTVVSSHQDDSFRYESPNKNNQQTLKHKKETKTRRNVWSYRFFHLYLVYFNSTKLVFELGVEEENIAIINIPALEEDKQHGVVGLSPTIRGYEKWFPLNKDEMYQFVSNKVELITLKSSFSFSGFISYKNLKWKPEKGVRNRSPAPTGISS